MIKLTIHKELILSSLWLTDGEFLDMGGTKKHLIELLNEDWHAFLFDECGGLEGIIEKVEIVGGSISTVTVPSVSPFSLGSSDTFIE